MARRQLTLSLSAGESIPTSLNWLIDDGYVTLSSLNDEDSTTTLGLWGPGERVIPSLLGNRSLQLLALSAVAIRECSPTPQERLQALEHQVDQLAKLLELSQMRRADERLFSLLLWLGQRFGRISLGGMSLSFQAMNLTHRNLAEITGMTRVTVTKALIRFRQDGRLRKHGDNEILLRQDSRKPNAD